MEKIAVFEPIPSASDRMATRLTTGVAFNARIASRRLDISATSFQLSASSYQLPAISFRLPATSPPSVSTPDEGVAGFPVPGASGSHLFDVPSPCLVGRNLI